MLCDKSVSLGCCSDSVNASCWHHLLNQNFCCLRCQQQNLVVCYAQMVLFGGAESGKKNQPWHCRLSYAWHAVGGLMACQASSTKERHAENRRGQARIRAPGTPDDETYDKSTPE